MRKSVEFRFYNCALNYAAHPNHRRNKLITFNKHLNIGLFTYFIKQHGNYFIL